MAAIANPRLRRDGTLAVATREELERLDEQAWALYGDMCHYAGATEGDRRRAFDAALAALLMLLDHDRQAGQ